MKAIAGLVHDSSSFLGKTLHASPIGQGPTSRPNRRESTSINVERMGGTQACTPHREYKESHQKEPHQQEEDESGNDVPCSMNTASKHTGTPFGSRSTMKASEGLVHDSHTLLGKNGH